MSKKVIYIILILLALTSLGVIAWYFISKKPLPGLNINTNPTPQASLYLPTGDDKENCKKTNDEEGCLKIGYYNWSQNENYEVITEKNIKDCDKYEGDSKEICKYSVATKSKNMDLCKDLKNKEACEIEVSLSFNEWDSCKKLPEPKNQEKCFGGYINKNRSKGEQLCSEVPIADKIKCLDTFYFSIGVGSYDYAACKKITDEAVRERCLKNLPPDSDKDDIADSNEGRLYHTNPNKKDTDDDGLNDWEEIFKYKTDPNSADSDNDGYKDGEEVKTGHNPLGK